MPKQDIAFEIFYDGGWHDLVTDDDVLTRDPIVIRRGQGDESPAPRPAQINATLANDDDRYRTSNPESPLYGRAGRNTPTRVTVGDSIRAVVEASSWSCDQSRDFRRYPRRGSAWTEFEGGGLLQRIGQWTEPLKSAFRQYNEGLAHCIGYFPCEQDRGATKLISTVPGTTDQGRAAGFAGFAFDSQHRPLGSGPLMDVGEQASLGIYFNRATATAGATAGWQLSWAFRAEPLGTTSLRTIMNWLAADGHGYRLDLEPATGEITIVSTILDSSASYGTYDWTQWTLISIDAQYAAGPGETTVWVNWTNADNTQGGFHNATFTGVPSSLIWWSILGDDDEIPAGSTIGHVQAVDVASTGGVNLFSAARIRAWKGHLGELAATRFTRLCDQVGIATYTSDSFADSTPMGPQGVATFAEHLTEIAATDDALIFDHRPEARLFMLCRLDRYNQTPAVTLTPADLPALPREVTDDLNVHNVVTAAQRDGGEATATDSTGPLGTQAPPDGVGEYRQKLDVNVSSEAAQLAETANWWMRKGTINLPRYPQVAVNLAALHPGRVAEIQEVDVGDVIVLDGVREYPIRLHVLGYTERIGTHSRSMVFVCAPDQQYDLGTYGVDQVFRRYGSASTTLKASLTTSGTSATFRTANALDVWSTTTPYDVMIAGQRCRVTSMGAASLVSGEYDQAATLVRGVDGITKPLSAGEPITVADGGIWGL